ncbi:DNA polymerase I [Candidatus Parcubacteria bacterium]|nr:DNA polymerase I [Candidatus Parcubacteria bacterium]
MKKQEKILIIDGNAIIHRSFHALPPTIKTKNNEVVNAVYGFASVLIKSIKEFKPNYIALTLDKKGPTFRHKRYKEYKAHRKKAPDELYKQIPYVKRLAKVFNIPIFEMTGYEADDLIGSIATRTKTQDSKIKNIIITGDMDLLQLINSSTEVYKLGRGISDGMVFDASATENKYNITPEQIIDYKALRGDASDNIPGVPGIGDKTAVNLLKHFKTLKNLYEQLENGTTEKLEKFIKPRIINLLKENKESAFLSKELATIECNVKIDFDLEKTEFGNFDKNKVLEFFSELEFQSLISRINELNFGQTTNKESNQKEFDNKFERNLNLFNYQLIDNDKNFDIFLNKLKKQKYFTFDTETTGINPLTCKLRGISFSWKKNEAYYINLDNEQSSDKFTSASNNNQVSLFDFNSKPKTQNLKLKNWILKLKPIFENPDIKKNAHNIKYDSRILKNNGINLQGIYFDTIIASYLLNPDTHQHGIDALTFSYFNFEKINKKDLLGERQDKITYAEVDSRKLGIYSCEDADFTNQLIEPLKTKLENENLLNLFYDIELPLINVLSEMEENGIKLNAKFLKNMSIKLNSEIKKLEKEIHTLVDSPFNVRSTKQLKEILFEKLEIPTKGIKKTKTGFSTAFDELEKIKNEHKIIPLIQNYRELSKLTSTYVDALPELINEKTKRVHSHFNQTVTATGRLSSSDPNLQNIPTGSEIGKNIRKAFIAEKGCKLLAIDYSQIELRIAAHLSGDKKMINAFKAGDDIHTKTAAEINKVELNDVTKEMRRNAKAINFGVLYGQGPRGLSKAANISFNEAKEFIENYFTSFSDVKKFIDKTIEEARKNEYVKTMFGRIRKVPEINSNTPLIKKAAERIATNMPIQGTAADIMKIAMIEVYNSIKNSQDIKLLLQVHDELVLEVKESEIEKYSKKIVEIMENITKLNVPLIADVKIGDNWGEMK